MFRVPDDWMLPTFDETFDVSFWMWLRSSKAERKEWGRRRHLATELAHINVNHRIDRFVSEKQAALVRVAERRAAKQLLNTTSPRKRRKIERALERVRAEARRR
jgi:hypothetical protein